MRWIRTENEVTTNRKKDGFQVASVFSSYLRKRFLKAIKISNIQLQINIDFKWKMKHCCQEKYLPIILIGGGKTSADQREDSGDH